MSDTPRTDAKAQFFGFNPDEGEEFVQADFARELERENAALKEQLNHTVSTKYHDEIVQEAVSLRVKETDNLRSELRIAESFHRVAVSERDALVVENAALRADKERLDWLESVAKDVICTGDDRGVTIGSASNFQNYATNVMTFRAAIDVARKVNPKWPTLEGRLANKLTSTEEAITQLKNTVEISPVAEQILNKNKSK